MYSINSISKSRVVWNLISKPVVAVTCVSLACYKRAVNRMVQRAVSGSDAQ